MTVNLNLTAPQCRVIGVLLEKESTTPEQYPLSLNALTNGCNQKSSRDPVTNYNESEIQQTLDELTANNLVSDQGAFTGRVAKYQHRFCNTEFGDLQFTPQQRAIVCLLLLRGPQTPGELRTRSNRLAEFSHVNEVEQALMELSDYHGQALVKKLPKQAGKRETRYCQLFSDIEIVQQSEETIFPVQSPNDEVTQLTARVTELELQVEQLNAKVAKLLSI